MKANDEELKILNVGSLARYDLIHSKRLVHHNPVMTCMCCVPILAAESKATVGPGKPENKLIEGLVLEFTGQTKGQYRSVGHFSCWKSYLDKVGSVESSVGRITQQDEWPSVERGSLEEGYTICIV